VPDQPLGGRRAVVTGGGRGIGAAIAENLASLGAEMHLLGRTEATLEEQVKRLNDQGYLADYRVLDVTCAAAVESCFSALTAVGDIDILVNNAGAAPSAPFHRMDSTSWRDTLAVNLDSVFYCCRAVIESMRKANFGRIVNIASTSALRGYAYVSAYSAAKHGVLGLTRSLALETAKLDITVNAVCPGFTETDLVDNAINTIQQATGLSAEQARRQLSDYNPQGRLITPEEVANSVAWLCSPGSEAITGQAIAVCGGEVM